MAETGRLDVGPLNHLLHPEMSLLDPASKDKQLSARKEKFIRGIANPFYVFGKEPIMADYETGAASRELQQKYFANRTYNDEQTTNLGIKQSGFPPFESNNDVSTQGDKQWWEVLSSGI